MVLIAPVVGEFATATGLLAGLIAVGGFVAHAGPALRRQSEEEIGRATVLGGMSGLGLGLSVVILSAFAARLVT